MVLCILCSDPGGSCLCAVFGFRVCYLVGLIGYYGVSAYSG